MGKRLIFFDVLKAFAIFLVIWGHCLQNMTTDQGYWIKDSVSQFILSVHMPLFMTVSGYFAYSSVFKEHIFGVLKKRFTQLVVPSVIWGIVVSSIAMIVHRDFTIEKLMFLLQNTLYSYWFVKALFFCYVLLVIFVAIYRYSHGLSYFFALAVMGLSGHLDYCNTMSMLPYFLMGILAHCFQGQMRRKKALCLSAAIIYIGCFLHWPLKAYTMYVFPFSYTTILQFAIRTLIGITGSITMIYLVWIGYRVLSNTFREKIAKVGQMTLGIYFIQLIFAEAGNKMIAPHLDLLCAKFTPPLQRVLMYDFIITPLASFIVLVICVCVINMIRKNPMAKLLLLGEK